MTVADPGLQPERTRLSWSRTSLAIVANGLLVVGRDLGVDPARWHAYTVVAAALSALAALTVYLVGRRRSSALAGAHSAAGSAAIAITGGCVVAMCIALSVAALVRS